MDLSFAPPASAPAAHRAFAAKAVPILASDPRIVGLAAAGSWADDAMDEHSDLDLVVAVASSAFEQVMADREHIASTLGNLVASFTGEHVGEPRVLICLYAQPLLHVDLKFVDIDRVGTVVDRPEVLWERQAFGAALDRAFVGYPKPDKPWMDDRFWTWIHYGVAKVIRGELFEAIDLITFLRGRVLGPLVLESVGAAPAGVRRLETAAPDWARRLEGTVPSYAQGSCLRAIKVCAETYRALRGPTDQTPPQAEHVAMRFLRDAELATRFT